MSRPNIVLIVSDQQRADCVPGGGAAAVVAPHLEWLIERGQTFGNAFCATPICSPSRASLLSGLFPHGHGLVANHQERPIAREIGLPANVPILADWFAPQGYACGYSGKWHLGTGSDRRGFGAFARRHGDHDVSQPEDNDMLSFAGKIGVTLRKKQHGLEPDPQRFNKTTKVGPSMLPLAYHPSYRDAAAAANFIRHREGQADPFLLVYSCHEPHTPFVSPRPFDTMISPADVVLPATWKERIAPELVAARAPFWRLESIAALTEPELRSIWAAYLGAVAYVDHLLGVILEALIDTDQFEDTIIVFTSDHGDMMGAHGVLLKGAVLYEEVVKVPLVMRVPARFGGQGRKIDSLVSLVDLVPTLCTLCEIPVPTGLHGRDLSGEISGGPSPASQGVAIEFHSSNWGEAPVPLRGWRTLDWKYVEDLKGPVELYDLSSDPGEARNRVHDVTLAPVLERLQGELHRWLQRTGDRWPVVPVPDRLISP